MGIKSKKRITVISILIVLLVTLIIWTAWGNTALELNVYRIKNDNLPQSFDGYRIAHISDLHNAEMGENNEKLLSMLKDSKPDIIAITGDIIDLRNTDIEIALNFANEAVRIAPCYYVTGNHEARISEYSVLKNGLVDSGVTVLDGKQIDIEQSGEKITLLGVADPSFKTDYLTGDSNTVMKNSLKEFVCASKTFTVLLSHRPELFDIYAENEIDLVLSGHAHGGQFRFPFVGGLVAPNQGLFPEYDSGLYIQKGTSMIVSRGIGNSIIPFRFNNRPEVILIELSN